VERAFGVLKARFTILVKRRNYPIKTQARIAMAYCILHNFIHMEGGLDYIFRRGQCDELVEGDGDVQQDDHVPRSEAARGDRFRNELATRLWIQHTARGFWGLKEVPACSWQSDGAARSEEKAAIP
ncbi:hypothetical protein Taro_036437, partial [Colocasia esculenta]|nr:hypothetical protein [Colocasia esculenta]